MAITYRTKYGAFIALVLAWTQILACTSPTPKPTPDEVFILGQQFANDAKDADEVKSAFDTLSDDDLEVLFEKKAGPAYFSLYMVMGKASADSREILEIYFAKSTVGNHVDAQVIGQELFKESLGRFHKNDENTDERTKISALILQKFPDQINAFNSKDAVFLGLPFYDIIQKVPKDSTAPVIGRLNEKSWDNFYLWVFKNPDKPLAQKVFQATYDKATPADQAIMRIRLLAHTLSDPNVNNTALAMISEAEAWGIKANILSDLYSLPAPKSPATTFKGSLLMVLAKSAIREFQSQNLDPIKAFTVLRDYALGLKNLLGDAKKFDAALHETSKEEPAAIFDVLKNALGSKYAPFTAHLLAADQPGHLVSAASLSSADFPNSLLKELYHLVIGDSPEKTAELAKTTDEGTRFIEALIKRPVDVHSKDLLDTFLSKLDETNVAAQLKGVDATKPPLKILAAIDRADDNPEYRREMLRRLLKDEKGDAVKTLTQDEVVAWADIKRKADMKFIYEKLAQSPELKKAWRDALLIQASNLEHAGLKLFVDDVSNPSDPYGLKAGLESDTYRLAANEGSLLMVLTKRAANKPKAKTDLKASQAAFDELRSFAQSIHNALGNDFYNHITNPDSIKSFVETSLATLKRQDFAKYYLSEDNFGDVYNAAARPQADVNNTTVKELYDLVITDGKIAKTLAFEFKDFIHHLLNRTPEVEVILYGIVNKFLNAIYADAEKAKAGDGKKAELAQITTKNGGGETAIKVLMKALPSDVLTEKLRLFSRLTRHATPDALTDVTAGNMTKLTPLLLKDPPEFKRLHKLLVAKNPDAALAMRSVLIDSIYEKSPWIVLAELKSLVDKKDPWGLRKDIDKLLFKLQGGEARTLLFALAEGAMKKFEQTPNLEVFAHLRTFATAIKGALSDQAYADIVPEVIAYLKGKIPRMTDFAQSYVAIDDVSDVMAAAGNLNVDIDDLRKLFKRIIGNNPEMALKLAEIGSPNIKPFVHVLIQRTIDKEGNLSNILRDFLSLLDADHAKRQVQWKLGAGNNQKTPLHTIAKPSFLDDPVQRMVVFDELIKPDTDDLSIREMTLESLEQDYFIAGEAGQRVFKKMYEVFLKEDKVEALILRNTLLKNALQDGLVGAAKLAKSLALWSLSKGIGVDNYQLDGKTGNLLAVLTERAIAEWTNNGSAIVKFATKPEDAGPLEHLRNIATALRAAIEDNHENKAGLFVAFAKPATISLKDSLDQDYKGYAEYLLDLDNQADSLNAELLLEVFQNKKSFSMAHVAWLYNKYTEGQNNAAAKNLAGKTVGQTAVRFIHLLAGREASKEGRILLSKFLADLDDAALLAEQVKSPDDDGNNAIQIVLKANKGESDEVYQILSELLSKAEPETIEKIAQPNDAKRLLSAMSKLLKPVLLEKQTPKEQERLKQVVITSQENIAKMMASLPKSAQEGMIQWSAENPSEDNSRLFKTLYARWPDEQVDLRNAVVAAAHAYGSVIGKYSATLRAVAALVKNSYFTADELKEKFKPFKDADPQYPLPPVNLLLAVFLQSQDKTSENGFKDLASSIKSVIKEEAWPEYIAAATAEAEKNLIDYHKKNWDKWLAELK